MPKSDILAIALMFIGVGLAYLLGGFLGALVALVFGAALLVSYYLLWRGEQREEIPHSVPPVNSSEYASEISDSNNLDGSALSRKARKDFNTLTWAQKIALKKIYESPGICEFDLIIQLTGCEFGPRVMQTIVTPLLQSSLLDKSINTSGLSSIEIKPGKEDMIRRLLSEAKLI